MTLLAVLLLACRAERTPEDEVEDTAPPADSAEPCAEAAWYPDADADGFGTASVVHACEAPDGYAALSGDCNDTDASIFPGAPTACSEADADCNGSPDNADADGDRFFACEDCDDADPHSFPGAAERCDGHDNDCNGLVDDDPVDPTDWYADDDGDGHGGALGGAACTPPDHSAATSTDCDDTNAAVLPGADELCNGIDDDCDGTVDDAAIDAPAWFIDYDGDGYGSTDYTGEGCDPGTGWVQNTDDCDDTDASVSPAGAESCNGYDDNCDGTIDEDTAVDALPWYLDADGDGEGDPASAALACSPPAGHVANDTDCDDTDADVYTAARETCDGIDENCDGVADDGALGGDATCAAASCLAILDDGSSIGDGRYWLDPDQDGDTTDAWEAWCDMTTDGGGWTRLYGSLWPYWWDETDWEAVGDPEDDNYSDLGERAWFADAGGTYTLRLEVGNSGTWNTASRAHYTVWSQAHDAFSDTTDGSDYTFIAGEESTTCYGFNGLHDQYYVDAGVHCMSSDVDAYDSVACWWMQIVPLAQYVDAVSYPGYLEGYDGANTHIWQSLSVR